MTYAKALARATVLNFDAWSDLGPKNLGKERRAKTSFSTGVSPAVLLTTLADGHLRWAYLELDGTIGTLFGPEIVTLNDVDSIIGSASDSIKAPFFVSIPIKVFEGVFTVLLSKTDAQDGSFPFTNDPLPETIPPPGDDQAQGHSFSDLGFENVTGDATPPFAFLPRLMPIPPGYAIPVGHRIQDTLPATNPAKNPYWGPFEVWCKGIKNMYTKNGGHLADSAAGTLFNPVPLDELDDFGTKPRVGVFSTNVHPLPRRSPFMAVSHQHHQELKEIWLLQWFLDLPALEPEFNTPTPTLLGTLTPEQLGAAIARGIADTPTTKDKAQLKAAVETKVFYQLLFARNSRASPTDPWSLRPAEVGPEFLAFLESPKTDRTKKLQSLFRVHLDKVLSSDRTYERNLCIQQHG
jgi:hypothetical protein